MSQVVVAFYKFVNLPDYQALRSPLLELCLAQGTKGTILLASEGINGTISGSREAVETVLAWLRADARLADLEHKETTTETTTFDRMKVRLKREIITMGVTLDPEQPVGTYVSPSAWNDLIQDPDVLLLDTRNEYEVELGTFKGAINPRTHSFREFPNYVRNHLNPGQHKKVALFCTGGIRCEKATAFMLQQGYEEVYHLRGGILKYLQEVPATESLWEGDCFVFDQRVALDHAIGAEQG